MIYVRIATRSGTAYIFADIFDEYTYRSESAPSDPNSTSQDSHNSQEREESDNAAFEIPLNTLIECLNIFGTAGTTSASANGGGAGGGKYKKWRRAEDESDDDAVGEDGHGRGRGRGGGRGNRGGGGGRGIDHYFGSSEKRTGMRMSYAGAGYPLTLLLWAFHSFLLDQIDSLRDINITVSAEDATGPTTTCEITTFDPEPHLELPFDPSQMFVTPA